MYVCNCVSYDWKVASDVVLNYMFVCRVNEFVASNLRGKMPI